MSASAEPIVSRARFRGPGVGRTVRGPVRVARLNCFGTFPKVSDQLLIGDVLPTHPKSTRRSPDPRKPHSNGLHLFDKVARELATV